MGDVSLTMGEETALGAGKQLAALGPWVGMGQDAANLRLQCLTLAAGVGAARGLTADETLETARKYAGFVFQG